MLSPLLLLHYLLRRQWQSCIYAHRTTLASIVECFSPAVWTYSRKNEAGFDMLECQGKDTNEGPKDIKIEGERKKRKKAATRSACFDCSELVSLCATIVRMAPKKCASSSSETNSQGGAYLFFSSFFFITWLAWQHTEMCTWAGYLEIKSAIVVDSKDFLFVSWSWSLIWVFSPEICM